MKIRKRWWIIGALFCVLVLLGAARSFGPAKDILPVCTPKGPSGFQDHGTRGWSGDRGVSMPIAALAVTRGGAEGADVLVSAFATADRPIRLGDWD